MNYSVHGDGSNVTITVDGVGSKQAALLKEFNECAEGRCTCPTTQYQKVASLQVTAAPNQIQITLKAKAGEQIEHSDINRCLEHTTRKVAAG